MVSAVSSSPNISISADMSVLKRSSLIEKEALKLLQASVSGAQGNLQSPQHSGAGTNIDIYA